MGKRLLLAALVVAALAGFALSAQACGGKQPPAREAGTQPYTEPSAKAISTSVFPAYVTSDVRDGYEYALRRPDVLKYLPCYCGCGLMEGHTSNLDCFIVGVERSGSVRFDDHGSFCDTCLQIARDAERLLGQGKTLAQVRDYVDATHGEKGPGTDTPRPPA
ncbi:MAG: PCYCGC motif-containing (lipo)protein [Chloroflexota bacterium]|nr:PCYCGC motif-containing (lipo)protein [Chloroflexota bacterium]